MPEVISSDESDDAEEAKFITNPLPWRSAKVNKLFESLDRKSQQYRRKRSKVKAGVSGRTFEYLGFPQLVVDQYATNRNAYYTN